jgi:hypothetical protein
MPKPMNAADYRRNAAEKRAQQATEIVTLKSGSVFELRRPDLKAWVMTGRVPQSLLDAGIKTWQEQGKVDARSDPAGGRMVTDTAVFFVRLVQSCTVSPRLVEFPDPNENEIGPETMLDEDFYEIVGWAMSGQGVAGIEALREFREGQGRGVAGSIADGPELQPEAVGSTGN